MTCGIYRLTFSSGRTYIGKSIDIENRWKQHFEGMRKGTCAKLMQSEFMKYGFPSTEIIYECHEDHIDILEETLIYRLNPELNTTKGRERLNTNDAEYLNKPNILQELLELGTIEHIVEIAKHREHVSSLVDQMKIVLEGSRELLRVRTKEELDHDVGKLISSAEAKADGYKLRMENALHKVDKLEKELILSNSTIDQLRSIPWWKKLFS